MSRRAWVNVVLALAIVALFAVPLAAGWGTAGVDPAGTYAGTDGAAVGVIGELDPGYTPWFSNLFAPQSGEIQSGLFALQAAFGAGIFGFAVGRLSGRRTERLRAAGAAARDGDA